jgi:DNA gyrase inhibitor GyrI
MSASSKARVVDKDATHDSSRYREEMCAILPLDRFSVDHADIGFVDECGGLEAVPHALSGHAAARNLMEFLMDQWDQSLARVVVSLPPFEKERSDIRGGSSNSPF